ncbi:MAG: aminotransferase class I/II-fold pyridoxal phosphate-dependent enzyme [Paramuribaculum sp.]|nr:aminotransferase class I/II-fold pyridoxal phosphate-dependent enzyme [Paramuribaculum sp.]
MTKSIQPASRVSEVKEYYFSKKLREVARLNAEGHDIISLGIGGPDRMPADGVIDTLCEEARKEGNHSYQSYTGLPALRQAYADFYSRWYGVELDPSTEILPLIGSKEGILHISLALLNPGDGVLVPNPGYPTYTSVSRLAQAEVFSYDLTEEGGWLPDFDQLEKMPLDRIKLMWVNYPHMPTGTQATLGLLQRIVDFGRRHDIVIAHDNPYSFILNDNPTSLLQVEGAKDVAIELNSMSKSHNMAGWRMGMLASNPTMIEWILKVKSNIDSGQFRPMMLAAAKGLAADESWYKTLNATYARRRAVAEEVMTALGCTFDPAQRGLFLWGRIADSESGSEAVADRALYESGVFITPGFIFGSNGDRYIRISLCATEEKLREALARIISTKK